MSPALSHRHAVFWMLATGFLAVSINTLARTMSGEFHAFQLVFFYNMLGLAVLFPFIRIKSVPLRTQQIKLFALRAVLEFCGFSLGFLALTQLPLPTHTALGFTSPLFATIFAIFLLREKNTIHRWIALFIGFLGILIITRPDESGYNPAMWLMLGAACSFALCGVTIKKLTFSEPPMRIAFYMLSLTALIALPFALWVWKPVPPEFLPRLALMGGLVALVQYTVSRALGLGEMTAIMPITYMNLLWSSLYAYVLFHEIITFRVLAGGGMIVAAAFYAARYGHRRRQASEVVQA